MISIIMPIYNRAHVIEETINSIKGQTYTDWECIIVDDGSTDKTVETLKQLVKNDERFQLYKRPRDLVKGPSACRNYGFTKIKGDYIQFFDSDDIMHPDHLKLKMEAIKNNDLVVCKLRAFSGIFTEKLFNQEDVSLLINQPNNLFEAFVTGDFPMMMVAPLWKVSSLKPYLPIREDLHILEDHELYARALFENKSLAIINKELIYYRIGGESSTANFYNNVDYGLASYFEAKGTVLKLSQSRPVKLSILKMTLGFFRQALAERNFKAGNKCLGFIREKELCYNFILKLKCLRIRFFYGIFKIIRKGDTKFKPLFKL
ncbi:Glycosyltransferase involved in cell wall bisynthesis [Hyunsoonleella jejuensis]|uniref:Glycosyltransferase involved in cell wall bisynthesis n=1 Tax=Hyunsoonleella jejuensis TaxID=419940 RepID=A0A1H9D7B5_9FLAO|nr:glycosyltransferase family 2 protein [Hyunsoonleella jejuensis]SEQ09355.1 Glycosyltransferase involved in cell wall bisynthesis [Hyunsoonleella jejuensis]